VIPLGVGIVSVKQRSDMLFIKILRERSGVNGVPIVFFQKIICDQPIDDEWKGKGRSRERR